jgi:UPF0755 protein
MRFVVATIVVLLLVAAGFGGMALEVRYFDQPGPSPTRTVVVITSGIGLGSVAQQLARAGVVQNALLFEAGVFRRGRTAQLKAGEYGFPPHASEATAMDMMVTHKVIEHRITIPEGLTSDMAIALLDSDTALKGKTPAITEGSLLPETYLFEFGTTRAQLIARMHKAQATLLAQLWPARKQGLPFQTVDDALKLASIVEKETAIASERPHVAAVYINRLKNGMKLDADPTIIYGLTKGIALGHGIRHSELQMPNPYSTYQIGGLPPTPICNPGKDSIAAVLMPEDSPDLYFVADGTGGHIFAHTKAEHEQNVARWRALEQQAKSAHSDTKFLR